MGLSVYGKTLVIKKMKKGFYLFIVLAGMLMMWSCSTKKNTRATRFYHSFTTRYNIYYNGKVSFDEALLAMQNGYKENYSDIIHMYPISAQPKDKTTPGGPFDRPIEKSNKAIKLHSIQAKPRKKPGWRSDPKQVALQQQEEYNPFLKNSWLMMGQAQFYNADFLQAAATFSYIARHYAQDEEVVAEARLWQARAYAELEWFYETEDILNKLNTNGIPAKQLKLYAAVNADYLVKDGKFEEAIPYLQTAIKAEKNKLQRTRMKYLLGQMYAELDLDALAYKIYGDVAKSNPPYELEFAARIRQTEVFTGSDFQRVVKMLERMAKSDKNKDLLDQVYYALGNIYLNRGDTTQAIQNYELGVEKSTRNGIEKAILQIRLGDLYFTMRDYVKAQPNFSGALAGIQKEYKDYPRVSKLSAVLDELVVHVEAVHLQDSLQTLARMPEEERLAVIDKIIEQVIKEEEEAKALAEKEAYLAEAEALGGIDRPGTEVGGIVLPTAGDGSSFYFYSQQTVAQGKNQFQRRWGRRPLEDDWRRRDKKMSTFDENQGDMFADTEDADMEPELGLDGLPLPTDSIDGDLGPVVADDPKTREYYIQQIPLTPEDIEASNIIIVDGLYNMGMIYKDKLEDFPLSIEEFERLDSRFPDNEHRLESYYQIFLMALRMGDAALAETYKMKLINAFPDSDYATAIADPNYETNIRMMDTVQNTMYESTYESYLDGDTIDVRRNYREVSEKYPLSKLMPKFMFLEALTYVQDGDVEGFKGALRALIEKYPDADVTELAGEMLKGVLRGRTIVQGNIRGMTWNLRFGGEGELSAADSARMFTADPNSPHRMMLVYPTGSLDRNQLLFAVAAYNFANTLVKTFDLTFEDAGPVSILNITGFYNLDEILQYYKMIYSESGYAGALSKDVATIPISEDNYETLMRGKTLDEYITFFEETFGEMAPELVERWLTRMESDMEEADAYEDAQQQQGTEGTQTPADEAQEVVAPDETPVRETQVEPTEIPAERTLLTDSVPMQIIPAEILPAIPVEEEVLPADSIKIEIPGVTVGTDTIPAVQPPVQDEGLTLKEIEEIRKREAEEKAAREEEERVAREAVEAEEKAAQERLAKEREELLKKQREEEEAILKTKEELEKQREQDRKAKLKQAEADRKAKEKARNELRKQKEKEYKERLKQRERERKQKEKEYKEKLKAREKAQRESQKAKEAAARAARAARNR